MTITRNDETKKTARDSMAAIANDAFVAGCATASSQATKTLSTFSCLYTSPGKTIMKAMPNVLNGIHINISRGSCATGAQLYTRDIGQELYGFIGALGAATFSGAAVACFLDTALTRAQVNAKSYFYFSPSLTAMYLFREGAFSGGVLVKGNLTQRQQDALLVASGAATAGVQKFITVKATKDILPPGITAPDFDEGTMKTLRDLGNGKYNHRAFNDLPFPSPTTNLAKLANVFWQLSGGPNAIAFRILHLLFFREMLRYSQNNFSLNNVHGFFQKKLESKKQDEVNSKSFSFGAGKNE